MGTVGIADPRLGAGERRRLDPATSPGGFAVAQEAGEEGEVLATDSLFERAWLIGGTSAGRRDGLPPTDRVDRPLGVVALATTERAGAPPPLEVPAGTVDGLD